MTNDSNSNDKDIVNTSGGAVGDAGKSSSQPTLVDVPPLGTGGRDGESNSAVGDTTASAAAASSTETLATTTTTIGSTTITGMPLDWTKMGVCADESIPLRYPHDVTEWSVEDTEISVVGTAGQKITVLGTDFEISSEEEGGEQGSNAPNRTNPNLKTLILRSHLIKDMSGLGSLKHLETLELYDNMVQSLNEESLMGCGQSLHVLDMSYNAIRDMGPVRHCSSVNLTELYLANNKLKTIAGLRGLTNLKKLDLGANRIRVMDPAELSGLINLEELWIGKNKIGQIDGLHKLTKLRRLDIQSNRLTKIENLESQVESLEELYLSHNGIDDDGAGTETGLALKFINLNMLDLSRNRLTTTSMFVHLSSLVELWLSGNEMETYDAVVPLRDASSAGQLPLLETIYLEYNTLASDFEYRKKLAEWIPTLKQIDATMIGGLAAQGMATTGDTERVLGAATGLTSTEEQLRHLQAAAIDRAKQQQQQQ